MPSDQKPVGRGPMIHIRLNPDIHKDLKMDAVEKNTTIQRVVESLISQYLKREDKRKKK